MNFEINSYSALLIVDMQNDFLPGGALAVPQGNQIIEKINQLAKKFYQNEAKVILTQDWHPKHHQSFASAHLGKNVGDPIDYPGLGPILWPDHCVQNTFGAEISPKIESQYAIAFIRKGYHQNIDSYSAFYENDRQTQTGLTGFLKELKIENVYICGLALDYCCFYSAMDAKRAGFKVFFLMNLTKGINQPTNSVEKALITMKKNHINII